MLWVILARVAAGSADDGNGTGSVLLLWGLCTVPVVLALGVVAVARSWGTPPPLVIHRRAAPPEPADALFDEIQREWNLQLHRAHRAQRPIALMVLLHGALASLVLFAALSLLWYSRGPGKPGVSFLLLLRDSLTTGDLQRWDLPPLYAFAAVAAVFLHSALTFGRLFRRASRRDLAPRTVAEAIRGTLACTLFSVAVVTLLDRELPWLTPKQALLAGGLMSLLGPGLADLIDHGVANFFGLYSASGDGFEDCTEVNGLDDDDRLRLQELGVDSLHSLAYSSVAHLFLNTRYSYERICDWKDQALLEVLCGKDLMRQLSDTHGIRGATALLTGLPDGLTPAEKSVAEAAAREKSVRLLREWKNCYPELPRDSSNTKTAINRPDSDSEVT